MPAQLFVLGVGPGDPELMTLKAARILREVPVLFVPKGREEGTSIALSIVEQVVDLSGKEVVETYFPMKKTRGGGDGDNDELDRRWRESVEAVLARLSGGKPAAFITIGDPSIYSTFAYLHERLAAADPELVIELVPGVSSVTAGAARAGVYLGIANERIALLPANYQGELAETLARFDTVVLMKVAKRLPEVIAELDAAGLLDRAVYVRRAGMPDEAVIRDLRLVREEDLNYFSMVIIRK